MAVDGDLWSCRMNDWNDSSSVAESKNRREFSEFCRIRRLKSDLVDCAMVRFSMGSRRSKIFSRNALSGSILCDGEPWFLRIYSVSPSRT